MNDVALLLEAVGLKALDRAGWHRAKVPAPESVAAHSWGVAWLGLALCPDELDRERVLTMAVIHDLAELRTGDITPYDGVPAHTKHHRERAAAHALLETHPRLLAVWEEYEAQATPEARLVRQLDRLDMALQAQRYHADGALSAKALAEFMQSARAVITHPELLALLPL